MEWLEKWVMKGAIKKVLDFVPFSGYKTIIGLVLLVVAAIINVFFPALNLGGVIEVLISWVGSLSSGELNTLGVVVAVVGAVHKALKRIYDDQG